MIRHVVLFRLHASVTVDDVRVRRAVAAEGRLAEVPIPQENWRFGANVTRRAVCADFVGVGDFASLDALNSFLIHPLHLAATQLWCDIATWTVAYLELELVT